MDNNTLANQFHVSEKKKRVQRDFSYADETKLSHTISKSMVFDNKVKEADAHDMPLIDLEQVNVATKGFSVDNKIGEGGFGPVYKVISCMQWFMF